MLTGASTDRLVERMVVNNREKGMIEEEEEGHAAADVGLSSDRTTLASDNATLGGTQPPSYHTTASSLTSLPPLPPPSPLPAVRAPRSPPSAFFTRRRQAADGGVRLGGRELALRRQYTTHSAAASSLDSLSTLSTLPPPYEPRD